MILNSLV